MLLAILAHLRDGLLDDCPFLWLELRVGEDERCVEVSEEQALGEPERLLAGK